MNPELELRIKTINDTTPWPELSTRWLAHAELGGRFGSGVELEIPPGAGYGVHRHRGVERVVYVREGSGTHRGAGGEKTLKWHDLLVLPDGEWHGFVNTSDAPAKLWLLYAPSTRFPMESYEPADGDAVFGGELIKRNLLQVSDDPAISVPERGFVNMNVIWDGAKGADQVTFGIRILPLRCPSQMAPAPARR